VLKLTGRGKRSALLDTEGPSDFCRLETVDIPHPILEDTVGTDSVDADRDASFLRGKERVPVRRRSRSRFAWKGRWLQVAMGSLSLLALGAVFAAVWQIKRVVERDPRLVLASRRDIQVTGNRVVSARQASAFFAPDIGRSIFHVPLARRRAQLEGIPWVRSATVMRVWPDRLRVAIVERTPIAFARVGNSVRLVDADGVLLDLPNAVAQKYSFPVITGIYPSDPASSRAARMQMYREFLHALDAGGEPVSATVSEVDLSDPEDIRAVFTGGARNPTVHLGDTEYLARYRAYRKHLSEWLQEYPQLRSVDMRYGRQIVLDTGTQPNADSASATNAGSPLAGLASGNQGNKSKSVGDSAAAGPTAPSRAEHVPVGAARKTGAHRRHSRVRHGRRTHRNLPAHGNAVRGTGARAGSSA
jgi:cell division protein FtsQ